MGKRKNRSKRSTTRLPKGILSKESVDINPFELNSRQHKRPKFHVHNRLYEPTLQAAQTSTTRKVSALASAVEERRNELKNASKANVFSDKRIGVRSSMTPEDQTLARLVRERTRQSKRSTQFHLGDEEMVMTHRGQAIGDRHHFDPAHVVLEDKEQGADLDDVETSMHFGGGASKADAYGNTDISTQYASRKSELDEMIMRRKIQKAEKQKSKGDQVDAFTKMDGNFQELSKLLSFRDKDKAEMDHMQRKRDGGLTEDDQEMADWDVQMKQFQLATDKVPATDRTKTSQEIAKEEADRLHELETRRLARMQGDFDDDDLSDVDDNANPEALDNESDNDQETNAPELSTSVRFTSDGLVRIDGNGRVLGKAFADESGQSQLKMGESSDEKPISLHSVGSKVMASYRASEQADGNHSWFSGKIAKVNIPDRTYDVEYDDGDFEASVLHEHISVLERPSDSKDEEEEVELLKRKRRIAAERAR